MDPAGDAIGLAVAVAGLPRVERALLALVDAAGGQLRLQARRGGATVDLATVPLPTLPAGPVALELLVFDDRVRARVGEAVVDAERGDLRDGQVAVVVQGAGRCTALHVDGLDAHVSQFATSRYAGFVEHIGSWDGVLSPRPGDAAAVAALRAATGGEIPAAMAPGADPQLRQRLFDRWIGELAIPLSRGVDRVTLAACADAAGTQLMLLESPEPLPLSRDVRLAVTHRVIAMPPVPPNVPRAVVALVARMVFSATGLEAPVPAAAEALAREARTLVLAVRRDRLGRRVEYRVYRLRVDDTGRAVLRGELVEVRTRAPLRPGFPPRPIRLPIDHLVLLDADGLPLTPALPLPVEQDVVVPLDVLTNEDEDRVLLIPAAPLAADTYTWHWSIDRARYRAPQEDDAVRYRAGASWRVTLVA
jgi:hypothetical protein